jgi:hypothetical protein
MFLLARQKKPRASAYGCADEASRGQVRMVAGMSKSKARGTQDEHLCIIFYRKTLDIQMGRKLNSRALFD